MAPSGDPPDAPDGHSDWSLPALSTILGRISPESFRRSSTWTACLGAALPDYPVTITSSVSSFSALPYKVIRVGGCDEMVRTRKGSLLAAAQAAEEEEEETLARAERELLEHSEVVASLAAAAAVAADAMLLDGGDGGVEAELTSLSWLQSLDITSASGLPTPPCSPSPPPPRAAPRAPPRAQPKKMSPLLKAQLDMAENADKYLTDANRKPNLSYAALIYLAMRANNNKVTLSNIYAWIRENFIYYKHADPSWQNSIRHNLSLNKCFVKLPRAKDEPGKGGFWKLDLERLDEARRPRRRSSVTRRSSRYPPQRGQRGQPALSVPPSLRQPEASAEAEHVAKILSGAGAPGPRCIVLYETPPSSVSPPIPETLAEVPESTQVNLSEQDFTDLLIESAAWDDGVENQLALLDSVLDML